MKHIDSIEEYEELVKQASLNKQLIFIKFGAVWCKPCKKIVPFLQELSDKYKNHIFIEIDIEEMENLCDDFGIDSLPTFSMIKNKKYTLLMEGVDKQKLKKYISKNIEEC